MPEEKHHLESYEAKLQREDEALWRKTHEFLCLTCEKIVRESTDPRNFLGVIDQYLEENHHLIYFRDYNNDVLNLVSEIENHRSEFEYLDILINMEKYIDGPGPNSFIEIDREETRNYIIDT